MKIKLSILVIALIFTKIEVALCVPSALSKLKNEVKDLNLSGLQNGNEIYSKSKNLGFGNQAVSARYRAEESNSGYLMHDETDMHTKTYAPLEPYGRLSKDKMEEALYTGNALRNRVQEGINSDFVSWLIMLGLQEPTIKQGAMDGLHFGDTKAVEVKLDRANELIFRNNQPGFAADVYREMDRCVATQTMGEHAASQTGSFFYGGPAKLGDIDAAKAHCESFVSTIKMLAARNSVGTNGCEWQSLVLWGHLSPEIATRNRAQFGDDELCAETPESTSGGKYITYELRHVAPAFSSMQLWIEEYQNSLVDFQEIIQKATDDKTTKNLTDIELAKIAIRPGLKPNQALIDSILVGQDPIRELPELVKWWAMEKAHAWLDITCDEARNNLEEANSSLATPTELRRAKKRWGAICQPLEQLKLEMQDIAKNEEVFANILSEGSKARQAHANSWIGAASRPQGRDPSQNSLISIGGVSPETGLNNPS
ncbi:MAG: hypothetical protein SGJ02_07010 [bacterium]|nr:hypothetical protein [bacterium]